jgi:hypothetical protein
MKEERAIKKTIIFKIWKKSERLKERLYSKYERKANDYIFVMFIFILKINYFFEKWLFFYETLMCMKRRQIEKTTCLLNVKWWNNKTIRNEEFNVHNALNSIFI